MKKLNVPDSPDPEPPRDPDLWVRRARTLRELEWELSHALLRKVRETIDNPRTESVTASSVAALVAASKLARLALGRSLEDVETSAQGYTRLDLEFLAALDKVYEKTPDPGPDSLPSEIPGLPH